MIKTQYINPKKLGALQLLKKGIWLYLILLIFEGGLRKWVFPSLATPLLIVRDPLALFLIFKSIQYKILKPNLLLASFVSIGFISFFSALIFGHQNLIVAVYGARAIILHFPLIFIIGEVFTRKDVIDVGKFLMYLLIPMTILTIAQFFSPQTSFINHGVGDDNDGAGFGGALGYFRPPGTFSFINGLSLFFGLCSSFVFYFLYESKIISKWVIFIALICIILSIPFTISRTVLFQTILCFSFSIVFILRSPKYIIPLSFILLISIFTFISIQNTNTFGIGIEAFLSRFESANESEGGLKGTLITRVFGTLIDAIVNSLEQPFWGQGIGSDTNVGHKILGVSPETKINDYEWSRIISEAGPALGIIFIYLRVLLCFTFIKSAIIRIKKKDFLPWMLLSFALLQLLQGQISQPTSLGFIILSSGLLLASLKLYIKPKKINIQNDQLH